MNRPKFDGLVVPILSTDHPVTVYGDTSDIAYEHVVIGGLSTESCVRGLQPDEPAAFRNAVKECRQKGGDALADIRYEVRGDSRDSGGMPNPSLDNITTCARGLMAVCRSHIILCDSSGVTFRFPAGLFYTITVTSLAGAEVKHIDDALEPHYRLEVGGIDNAIYAVAVRATSKPAWTKAPPVWVATRWVEVKK